MRINKLPSRCDKRDEKIVTENIARNIKIARMSVGLSQDELAREIGFKSATPLSLIESGQRKISTGKLWLISRITGNDIKSFCLKGIIES